MKVYSVKPGTNSIRVSDGRALPFSGDGAPLAIVTDVIGDKMLAAKYLRFRWRWPIFDSWKEITVDKAVTENEIKAVIAEIDRSNAENAPLIARQQREKPLFVSDAAGPGQAWDSNPDRQPNKENQNVSTAERPTGEKPS